MKRALLLLAVALAVLTQAQTVPYTKFTLGNGMTFILHEDHSVPIVVVNTWFHVGSKDEPEHRSGFAHLFEHLMFMGTFRAPNGVFDKLMEAGGGDNNASTTQDRTNFYDYGPSNLLPTLLWLEADRLEDLGKAMDQHKVNLQRQVVLNERRQTENSPYGNSSIKLPELMYPVGHPYHFATIGLPVDLNAATVQDVKDFFATYYVPNNATMVIAGDFDSKAIRPMIDKWFGTRPRRDDPVHRSAPQPEMVGQTRLTMVDQVQYPRITMAWHSPPAFQPGDAEMDLTADVLSNGISSRLYQKLIYQDKLATDVSANEDSEKLGSIFTISVTAKDGVPLSKIEKETNEVVADYIDKGPTAEELQRQVAQIEFSKLNALQSMEDLADTMNEYDYYFGNPDSFKADLDRYRNATPASVRQIAQGILAQQAPVVLTVVPASAPTQDKPRDVKPSLGKAATWTPPAPVEMTLANGVKAFYWQRPALPLMAITTLLRRGSDLDPAGKSGVADLTTEMLSQGAGGLSATDFSNALDQLGASFSASAGVENTGVSLSCTQANFSKALGLYTDALIRPNFDPKEWDRVKQLHIEGLQQALDDPATVGQRMAAIEYFGSANAYGRPADGTLASVPAVTLDDVKAEHAAVYQPGDAVVFAAGSMSPDSFKGELDATLGKWVGSGSVPAAPAISSPAAKPLRVYVVDKPGAVQTVVRFVLPAPTAHDARRIRLEAIGSLFGGTFTSRLNANLRENKGYTYGAGASYSLDPSVGYFVAGADVRTNVTGASLTEFLKEFASVRTGNITADEVLKSVGAMRTERVQSASTVAGLVGTAASLYEDGRSYTDLGKDFAEISGLTPASLNAIVKGALPLENGVLILVGDKGAILAQLQGLGLPAPVFVKAE